MEASASQITTRTVRNCWRKAGLYLESDAEDNLESQDTAPCNIESDMVGVDNSSELDPIIEDDGIGYIEDFINFEPDQNINLKKSNIHKVFSELSIHSERFLDESITKKNYALTDEVYDAINNTKGQQGLRRYFRKKT